MDREDQDHFNRIAAAQVVRRAGSLTQPSTDSSTSRPDPVFCLKQAKTLFGCYRKDEVHDPDTYCAAVAVVLSDYTRQVILFATDPRTGIASKIKWLPNIAEVKGFLDDTVESINANAKRDRDLREQFARRAEFEETERNRASRPTYDELAADCARRGIFIGPVKRATSAAEIKDFRERHGITQEQWNAIPSQQRSSR